MGAEEKEPIVNWWRGIIGRARLGPYVTCVGLVLASYASPDGSDVFPGVARLAVECEVDYRTARRALARLRQLGLIELVKRGNRRRGQADEYRLVIPDGLLEHCAVLTPDELRKEAQAMTERQNAYHRSRATCKDEGRQGDHRSGLPCKDADYRSEPTRSQGTGALPPTREHPPELLTHHDHSNTGRSRAEVEGTPSPSGQDRIDEEKTGTQGVLFGAAS